MVGGTIAERLILSRALAPSIASGRRSLAWSWWLCAPSWKSARVQIELRLVTSVANEENVAVWIDRAAERTVKHLRVEIDTVQMLERLTGNTGAKPPSVEVMAEVERAQSRITSGRIFQEAGPETQKSAPVSVT